MKDGILDRLLIALHKLPEAGGPVSPQAMEARALDEVHYCALCPRRARYAVVAGPGGIIGPARWLDVCYHCHRDLHELTANWPGDEAVLNRYAMLQLMDRIPV